MIYLFDVDGTITSSRGVMDPDFKKFFKQLPEYSLVTGSDIDKTVEQVGQDIFNNAKFCFNCSGNDVYQWGKALTRNAWIPNQDVLDLLEKCLQESPYKHRFGNHIEQRPGMINFSHGEEMPFCINQSSKMPEVGDLYIFPAWLTHYVHAFKSDVERISVSGNISFDKI